MNSPLIDYVGKTVLLNVTEEFSKSNAALLQSHTKAKLIYARLEHVEHVGLWVENPTWKTQNAETDEMSTYKVLVLIPWHSLVSVALFPERAFECDTLPNEKEAHPIGFIWNES